ncbi:YdcF family protein [Paenibacillus psychroresistens]|nr:YdcF family protein [Paenibacillus psychroresistens]
MVQISHHAPEANANSMIILGAKLNGDQLSLALKNRMDVALTYLKSNPSTQVIVSGGQGSDELTSEAAAMKNYLIKNQIDVSRIQTEALSTSTFENIKFSRKLIQGEKIILVSNDFHVLRAKMIAKNQGLIVDTLAAPTPKSVRIQLYGREYIALIKSFLLDR